MSERSFGRGVGNKGALKSKRGENLAIRRGLFLCADKKARTLASREGTKFEQNVLLGGEGATCKEKGRPWHKYWKQFKRLRSAPWAVIGGWVTSYFFGKGGHRQLNPRLRKGSGGKAQSGEGEVNDAGCVKVR